MKLQRVLAYCLRFVKNLRSTPENRSCNLTADDINNALQLLVKASQAISFPEEIKALSCGKPIAKTSKLKSLNPFLDQNGVLRVGGRLTNSDSAYDERFPIILCRKHHLTKLIFESEHKRLLHAGPLQLLSTIRDRFWTIGGRSLAKLVVTNCIQCFRAKPKQYEHILGNLPADRLTARYPFQIAGTDFAGPVYIKDKPGRGARKSKCYILLFICFVTKAVHLELVTDLTVNVFIMTLRRFASRRDMPSKIYSATAKLI